MSKAALSKLLASNPKAQRDERTLRDGLAAVESLRQMGIHPQEYKLKSPFQRAGTPSPKIVRYSSSAD